MRKNKTILFVTSRFPFPPISGRKKSLYHYCRILSEKMGYRLVVASFSDQGGNADLKPDFIDKLVLLPTDSAMKRIFYILKDSLIFRKLPMQVALYWSTQAKQVVDQLVEEEKPAIVIADMVRCIEYIKNIDAYRISDLDDRLSLRYQRQLETDIDGLNPYGAFLYSLPHAVQSIMLIKCIKKIVMKNEISLLKKYELEMGKKCDCTIFVARNEALQFNNELKAEKAVAVPIGVDVEYFTPRAVENSVDYIGFLGDMKVAHNENAVNFFQEKVLPILVKKHPNAKLLVIGGGASEALKNGSDYAEYTGFVEDVRDYLALCKVFVCPLLFGSGIKTKSLEAMSMGLPVVTTTIGAENIEAEDGKDWIIADGEVAFAEAISALLENEAMRADMGRHGRDFIQQSFTWDVAQNKFEELFESI